MYYPEASRRQFMESPETADHDYWRQRRVIEFKQSRAVEGTCLCDVCRWVPLVRLYDGWRVYHGHHVVPVSCGGSLDSENLVLLCPTCHALAHFLYSTRSIQRRKRRSRMQPGFPDFGGPPKVPKEWTGPQTPAHLVSQMREALGLAA